MWFPFLVFGPASFPSCLSLCVFLTTLSSFAVGATEYVATTDDVAVTASLAFDGANATGRLCYVKKGALSGRLYRVSGKVTAEGEIDATLISDSGGTAGSMKLRRDRQDSSTGRRDAWTGQISMDSQVGKPISLEATDTASIENNFTRGGDAGIEPGVLIVVVETKNFEKALKFLKDQKTVADIKPYDDSLFASGLTLDECKKEASEFIRLFVFVDEFQTKDTYSKLVKSGMFHAVTNEPRPAGPDSVEIPVRLEIFGKSGPSNSRIQNFLDMIVERYFRQLRTTADACRKHDGKNVLAALDALPVSSTDQVIISPLVAPVIENDGNL
jgi:hypothetical protein